MERKINNQYGHCSYCICDKYTMIYNLYVKKDHRRKGYAKALIEKAIDEIRKTGYTGYIKVIAESDEDINRDILVRFYENMGLILMIC